MFCARIVDMLVMPKTKHIASSIFDFPLPFRPVIELKVGSQPLITVLTAYDLKPSITISTTLIMAGIVRINDSRLSRWFGYNALQCLQSIKSMVTPLSPPARYLG